jgi:hypothetical protein
MSFIINKLFPMDSKKQDEFSQNFGKLFCTGDITCACYKISRV